MKHLKYFEHRKIKNKNIKVASIYRTGTMILRNSVETIPLAKIISIQPDGKLKIKTYLKDNYNEEYLEITKSWIINIASPSEIEEFESIEQSKKYNL